MIEMEDLKKQLEKWKIQPPAPDACQICGGVHPPEYPHNKQSLYYQYSFAQKFGRWPSWYAVRDAKKRNWKGGRPQKTVWDIKSIIFEEDKTSHPTQKPVEIYLRPINIHTNPGEYIYEPFGGSGTAVIAAQMTDRRCLCMEMDPKFVDVIINIWEKMTEESAIRESDGKSYSLLKEAALALNK